MLEKSSVWSSDNTIRCILEFPLISILNYANDRQYISLDNLKDSAGDVVIFKYNATVRVSGSKEVIDRFEVSNSCKCNKEFLFIPRYEIEGQAYGIVSTNSDFSMFSNLKRELTLEDLKSFSDKFIKANTLVCNDFNNLIIKELERSGKGYDKVENHEDTYRKLMKYRPTTFEEIESYNIEPVFGITPLSFKQIVVSVFKRDKERKSI